MEKETQHPSVGFIEKFIPPLLTGAFLFLIFYFLPDILSIDIKDQIVVFPLILFFTRYLIKRKRGPRLKSRKLGKIYNYIFEKDKYELDTNKYDLRNFIDDSPMIKVYYSTAFINNGIFWSVILISASIFLFIKDFWISGLGLGCLLVYGAKKNIKMLKNRSPQLLISRRGIATARLGFVNWTDIKHVSVADRGSDGPEYFLEIYLSEKDRWTKPDEKLYLEDLSIPLKKLKKMIESKGRF